MQLPIFQTTIRELSMLQTRWSALLNPTITNSLIQGRLLQNVALTSGDNTVNHKLGRKLVGWYPTRVRASATLYDKQDTNVTPAETLILNASAGVTVDLWVF